MPRTKTKFTELVEREHGSSNWVLARRTASILRRYGPDVVTLSKKEYRRLEDLLEWESAPAHPAGELIAKLVAEQYPAAGFIRALRSAGYRIEKV